MPIKPGEAYTNIVQQKTEQISRFEQAIDEEICNPRNEGRQNQILLVVVLDLIKNT